MLHYHFQEKIFSRRNGQIKYPCLKEIQSQSRILIENYLGFGGVGVFGFPINSETSSPIFSNLS